MMWGVLSYLFYSKRDQTTEKVENVNETEKEKSNEKSNEKEEAGRKAGEGEGGEIGLQSEVRVDDEEKEFLWKVEKVVEEWNGYADKGFSVCVVGRVSSGKSSLVSALFIGHPDEESPLRHKIKVGPEAGTTQKPCVITADLGTTGDKILIIDLPGLHEASNQITTTTKTTATASSSSSHSVSNFESIFHLFEKKKKKIDLGILVMDGAPTEACLVDFERLKKVSKKVFLVYNKIDQMSYLKKEKIHETLEKARITMGCDEKSFFPTSCKGFDPNADRSVPNWLDLTGVEELKSAILKYVNERKSDVLIAQSNKDFWKNLQNVTLRAAIGLSVIAIVMARRTK